MSQQGRIAFGRRWWPRADFATSIAVHCPGQSCWRLLSEVGQWPTWVPTVSRVAGLDGSELRPGARFRIEQPGLRTLNWVVTDLDPGHGFAWHSSIPGLRLIARHELSRRGDATILTLTFSMSGMLAPLAAWRLGHTVRRALEIEALAFKRHSEMATTTSRQERLRCPDRSAAHV